MNFLTIFGYCLPGHHEDTQKYVRFGKRIADMMPNISKLQGNTNEEVNTCYSKLYNMKDAYHHKKMSHQSIRDFILLMLIVNGNANISSLTEMTKKVC